MVQFERDNPVRPTKTLGPFGRGVVVMGQSPTPSVTHRKETITAPHLRRLSRLFSPRQSRLFASPRDARQHRDHPNRHSGSLIQLEQIGLEFVHYHDKQLSFKSAALDLILRRPSRHHATRFEALKEINLTVRQGERVGIVGPNGAGKSTLLRLIAGIYPPTVGRRLVRGSVVPLIEMGAGFHPELTGVENIQLNGAMLGMSPSQVRERIDSILDFAELRDFADQPIKYYSLGMQARLAFTVATELDPDILLIDEALAPGDASFATRAKIRLKQLYIRSHIVMIVSHDMSTLMETCTRGIWIDHGRIVADGPIAQVVNDYLSNRRGDAVVLP